MIGIKSHCLLIYILHLNFAGWWRTWGWEVPRHASILGWCSETVTQRYGWLFYLEVFWHCTCRYGCHVKALSKLCVELWKLVLDGQSLWVCWFIIFFNVKYCLTVITLCNVTHVPADFQMRCPHGKKTKVYKRAKLEKFAHYLMKDGLISRLSVYEDRECKQKFLSIYLSIIHGS